MTNLNHKVALVTGSARGIGKAMAERFGGLGASVVVNYFTSEEQAQETVAAIEREGALAMAVRADVSRVADIDRLFATTIERYGRVDIAVANAGIEVVGTSIADVTEADYDRVFDVNTKGAFFTLRGAARHIADKGALSMWDRVPPRFRGWSTRSTAAASWRLSSSWRSWRKNSVPAVLESTPSFRPSSPARVFRPTK
jgi:3-oxoacyl-[acyl-carrier protein] reductase